VFFLGLFVGIAAVVYLGLGFFFYILCEARPSHVMLTWPITIPYYLLRSYLEKR